MLFCIIIITIVLCSFHRQPGPPEVRVEDRGGAAVRAAAAAGGPQHGPAGAAGQARPPHRQPRPRSQSSRGGRTHGHLHRAVYRGRGAPFCGDRVLPGLQPRLHAHLLLPPQVPP